MRIFRPDPMFCFWSKETHEHEFIGVPYGTYCLHCMVNKDVVRDKLRKKPRPIVLTQRGKNLRDFLVVSALTSAIGVGFGLLVTVWFLH